MVWEYSALSGMTMILRVHKYKVEKLQKTSSSEYLTSITFLKRLILCYQSWQTLTCETGHIFGCNMVRPWMPNARVQPLGRSHRWSPELCPSIYSRCSVLLASAHCRQIKCCWGGLMINLLMDLDSIWNMFVRIMWICQNLWKPLRNKKSGNKCLTILPK